MYNVKLFLRAFLRLCGLSCFYSLHFRLIRLINKSMQIVLLQRLADFGRVVCLMNYYYYDFHFSLRSLSLSLSSCFYLLLFNKVHWNDCYSWSFIFLYLFQSLFVYFFCNGMLREWRIQIAHSTFDGCEINNFLFSFPFGWICPRCYFNLLFNWVRDWRPDDDDDDDGAGDNDLQPKNAKTQFAFIMYEIYMLCMKRK